jgi:glycosyltransferase involved in cell wall biosynthesis
VLYVGRLAREKSVPTLLHAFTDVSTRRPESRLTIVGSGPERVELEALAEQLGIGHATRFAGALDGERLAAEYATASCLVLPSASEPWGLVVNEALHYGCPVIASNRCGCVPELVHDGDTGYVFEAGEATDLAAKVLAAVDLFAPVLDVALRCQATVAPFTPEAAARNILDGCRHAAGPAPASAPRGQRPRTRSMLSA